MTTVATGVVVEFTRVSHFWMVPDFLPTITTFESDRDHAILLTPSAGEDEIFSSSGDSDGLHTS